MYKIFKVLLLIISIILYIIIFMIDHKPEEIKTSIVQWLELFGINEKNIPSFLYSIHSAEQIPYFFYIHKAAILILLYACCNFFYNRVKKYGIFHYLYNSLLKFKLIEKDTKKPIFISLHDSIAKIIHQLDVKQLFKDYKFDDYTIYPYLKHIQCNSFELLVIFTLILEEKLILYGHKIIDTGHNVIDTSDLPLQRIPKEFLVKSYNIYNNNSWINNYSIILTPHGGYEYIDVSIKSTQLDDFIEQQKSTNI